MGLAAQFIDPLYIYAPRRSSRVNLLRPENSFIESAVFLSGVFTVKQAVYDEEYVLVSKNLARQLFEYDSVTVTSVELKLKDGVDIKAVQKKINAIAGDEFTVKDRYEQQESFFSIMQIEKWISYLILSFILLIASFNIIGSLSMLIIDKKADIATLSGLGADEKMIQTIFLFEGWMISLVGAISGIIIGTAISLIQQHFQLLKLGQGYLIDAYPVVTSFTDITIVFITVLMMGFLAAWYPIRYIKTGKPGENNK
jgi:ABC-type lipoprotein release transport system permease subunit